MPNDEVTAQIFSLAATLVRRTIDKENGDPLINQGRKDAADHLVQLARNPDALKIALRPGTISN